MAVEIADVQAAAPVVVTARPRRGDRAVEWHLPLAVLGLAVLACFGGPAIFHLRGPSVGSISKAFLPVGSPGHLLGTDATGDDVLSRCLFGGRASLEIGLGASALGCLVGGALGAIAGFLGGLADASVMRLLDMLLAFPSLLLAMCVSVFLGQSVVHVMYALAFFTVPANARIVRSGVVRIREREFISAASFGGRGSLEVMVRHVVPNVAGPLVTFGLLSVATVMLIEAALSFLGVGVPPSQASWGSMIASGQSYLSNDPSLVLIPSGFLFVTVLSLNVVGDGLRARWQVS